MSSVDWKTIHPYEDIRFETSGDGIARVTICRPEKRNAFRPETTAELIDAFTRVREMADVGVVLLTGVTSAVGTAASLSGYMTVWAICGGGALIAGLTLFMVPKSAFGDAPAEIDDILVPGAEASEAEAP